MSGLVDGRTAAWDFVALQLHRDDHKRHSSGIIAASKPTPRPAPTPPSDALTKAAAAVQVADTATVLEQTRLIARMGLAARDLGHAIANNLRRMNTQENHQ